MEMTDWNSWVITTDERVKHDAQFQFLKPTNGYITGEQVKLFFLKSGLSPTVLGQIWSLADMDADGKLDKKEFSIAMFLIKKKLEGMQLPPTLPIGMRNDPQPVFLSSSSSPTISRALCRSPNLDLTADGLQSSTSNLNGISTSASPVPSDGANLNDPQTWTIGPNSRPKYRLLFNQHDRAKRGFITGVEARGIFLQSGLSQPILAHIWSLSDLDKDGNLNCDEFCIASFLIEKALSGVQLPASLPSSLHPSQLRAGRLTPSNVQAVKPANEEENKAPVLSFEDKRRENFRQGQLELDRRKQELAEQLRREEEARLEKERQEQERQEKIRIEKEREKALETERQAERLRELEAQREVRRRQAAEARNKAWRAAEAKRQLEAERQRVEALQKEKCQASTLLEQAIAHRASLFESAASQEQRKRELETRLLVASAEVDAHKSAINDMRDKRDTYERDIRDLTEQVEAAKAELSRWQREREQLNLRISTGVDTNPTAEQCKTLRAGSELRRASIQRLESQLVELDEGMTRQGEQLASRRNTVTEMEKRMGELGLEVARLRQQLEGQLRSYVTLKNPSNADKLLDGLGSLETGDHPEQYEVMFDFTARHPDELSLTTGSIVQIAPDPPFSVASGWLYGESNGMKGLFPESYVRKRVTGKIDPFDPFGVHKAAANPTQKSAPSSAVSESTLMKQTNVPEHSNRSKSDSPTSTKTLFSCIALFPFESTVAGDLNLAVNDVIHVHTIRDEWWEGVSERTKLSGLFPANYTKKLTPEELRALKTSNSTASPSKSNGPAVMPNPTPPVTTATAVTASSQPEAELTVDTSKTASPVPGSGQNSPSSHVTVSTKPEFARVIAPYTATAAGQLSLQPGQVVQLRKRSTKGWWEGELQQRGRVRQFGWFPADYVKVISAASLNGSQTLPASSKAGPLSSTAASNTSTVIMDSSSVAPTVNSTSAKAPPTNSATDVTSTIPTQSVQPAPPTLASVGTRSVEIMQAIFSYKAAHADELTFEEGAIITVLGRDEPEWWRGRLQSSGAEGLFPVNYVRPYTQPVPGGLSKQSVPHGSTITGMHPPAVTRRINEPYEAQTDSEQRSQCRENKRNMAIRELLETEEAYASDLLKLQTDFQEPLRRSELLPEDELARIFSNSADLHQLSCEFHRALREQLDTAGGRQLSNNPISIGSVFLQYLPKFNLFRYYCKHQEAALYKLQAFRATIPQLDAVLLQCERECLPLFSYLLKPMQRLTRYKLLLQRILADTPPFHPDHESTVQANERLTSLLHSINAAVGSHIRKSHIHWLQNHLLGDSASLTWLFMPHRLKLLHYGTLFKPKSNRELVAFLFNSHLLLTVPNPSLCGRPFEFPSLFARSTVTLKLYRQPIQLGEVVVSAGTSISNVQVDKLFSSLSVLTPTTSPGVDQSGFPLRCSQSSLEVTSPTSLIAHSPSTLTLLQPVFSLFSRSHPDEPLIRLKTKTTDERDKWISHLWKAIQTCARRSSFSSPSRNPAPVKVEPFSVSVTKSWTMNKPVFDALYELTVGDQVRQKFLFSQDQESSSPPMPARFYVASSNDFFAIWAYDLYTHAPLGHGRIAIARLLDSVHSTSDHRTTMCLALSDSSVDLQVELTFERTPTSWNESH